MPSRTLRKTQVATAAAVLSLALAMGANAAIYSLYHHHHHMLAPLPVAQPVRLVNLEAPGPKPWWVSCTEAGG
ncbi:MAG: hypothetical protein F4137_16245 [Acidobacteria bacterium]|nr:hypothetical protein [Acidobacteriota bacterium]MYH30357.1 hypothetical protein [Acidobacteriota bacterium]